MKAVSVLISAAILTAIIVSAIAIVISIGLPAIDRSQEALLLSEAKNVLTTMDDAIRNVLIEGRGSSRVVPVAVSGGEYFVRSDAEDIFFRMTKRSSIAERGIYKKEGNFFISTGADVKAYDNGTTYVMENPRILVSINKTGSSTSYSEMNTSNLISKIRIKDLAIEMTPVNSTVYINNATGTYLGVGYTQLLSYGSNLRDATVKAYIESPDRYEIHYTLRSNADFLLVEVKDANTTLFNYTVELLGHLGSSKNNDILNVSANLSAISSLVWTQKSDWGTGMFNNTTVHSNTTNYVSLIQEFVNDTNTVALWHFNEGSGANYSDSSTLENLTTLQGGADWTGNAKFGDAAANFTNATVYANMTMSASMLNVFESGTYTVEGWVYINETGYSTNRAIYGIEGGGPGGEGFMLYVKPTTGVLEVSAQSGSTFITGKAQAPLREWFHVAVVSSSTSRLFLNGGQEGTTASLAIGTGGRAFLLNRRLGITGFPGMQDEVRISRIARYTSNFTLNQYPLKGEYTSNATTSPSPITSVTAAWNMTPLNWTQTNRLDFNYGKFTNTTVPTNTSHYVSLIQEFVNDTNTLLLMHLNSDTAGGENSTYSVDSSLGNNGTISGATWNCTADNFKLGGCALSFDGADDYVNLSGPAPSLPFTIEFWIKPNVDNPIGIFDSAPNKAHVIRNYPAGSVQWFSSAEIQPSVSLGLTANQWYHIALVFNHNGTHRLIDWYKNGAAQTSAVATTADANFAWSNFRLGDINRGGDGRYSGIIDEVRISNTTRYTAGFTPNPYPQSGNFTSQSLDFSGNATVYRAYANVSEIYVNPGSDKKTNITLTLGYSQDKITWFSANTSDAVSINGTYAFSVPQTTARYWNWTAALRTNASNTTPVLDDVELEYGPTVEVSADGSNYIAVANNTAYTSGAGIGSGTSLRWRANFTTNNTSFSPALNEINITYDYKEAIGTKDTCLYDVVDTTGFLAVSGDDIINGFIQNLTDEYRLASSQRGKAYVIASRGTCDNFRRYRNSIFAKSFLEPLKAFSYGFNDTLDLVLNYNATDIVSDLRFGKGSYQLVVENRGFNTSTNKQMLYIGIVK